jgi:hypothetical protein
MYIISIFDGTVGTGDHVEVLSLRSSYKLTAQSEGIKTLGRNIAPTIVFCLNVEVLLCDAVLPQRFKASITTSMPRAFLPNKKKINTSRT